VYDVEVTPRAAAQIERAAAWWEENRPAAPNAILDDFEEAKLLLSRQPGIGAKSSTLKYPDIRRLLLARIRYHIYYRVRPGKVVILAFWHSSRASRPLP
jgi:plasmid stabilization system protein ParE